MMLTSLSLFAASALASSCNSADKAIWDKNGEANFSGDERHCALRCGGQNPCTGDCMSNTYGYSHDCGQCFGALSSCVVAHCVLKCGADPSGSDCKSCTDQHCTPDFESCTGFTAPSKLEAPMTSCDASDMTKLKALTKTAFDAETRNCALKCAGQNPCVGNCIKDNYGYTQACGMCFGDLTSCAVAKCVVAPGNCGVDPNGSACATCMAEQCDPQFKTCTGVATPTLELGDSGCASWCHWITNPNTLKLLPECSGCSGVADELEMPMTSCDASDMTKLNALTKTTFDAETKHCALECGGQNPCVGDCIARDYGYSKSCAMCFGDLTSCAVANCVVAPGNCGVDPNGSACAKCMADKCDGKFKTCTGVATPTLELGDSGCASWCHWITNPNTLKLLPECSGCSGVAGVATPNMLALPTADSCDAADMTKLNALTKSSFDAETKHCALECGGQNPCVGDCIARDYGYSKSCGMCFGELTSCAVANCVVAPGNCGVDPNGSACANCMAENCDGKFKTCTGVAAPTLLALPMADSCDAADMTKLQALTKSSFDAETKHCALECGGQNPCVGDCIARDYGYSKSCGMCFGELTSCAVASCVVAPGNCGVDPNGSACANCMAEKCDGKFKTCTGVATPTLELGDAGCASWCHWITNPNTLKLLPECSGCSNVAGVATPTMLALPMADSCDASDMTKLKALTKTSFDAETKHCALECGGQNPCTGNCVSRDYGYSKACGQCFGGLTSCTVAHCVVAPGNCGVDPNGSDCSKCVNQHCTPAFETCTGWTTPALAKLRDDMPAGAVLCPGFPKDAYCDCDPESDCTNDWHGVNTCTCDAAKACCAAAGAKPKPEKIPSGAPRMFAPKRVSSA